MQQQTIRLLIINDSPSEAERLISMLQNAGRSVRATYVESDIALTKLLQEKLWDLLIAADNAQQLAPVNAMRVIRRLNKDVPLILLTDAEGSQACVDGLKIGAKDVVRLDEDQHLLLVIDRELNNRLERENRRGAERRFMEISRRNQQLLDSSRDAIAFVQDGMFLYANDSFAEMLAFASRDDLECLPVIDIVKADSHDKLKSFLKNFMLKADESEHKTLSLTVVQPDQRERTLEFEVRKAVFDDESCIQLLHQTRNVDTAKLEAQIAEIRTQDAVTGLYNRAFMLEQIEKLIEKARANEFSSALLHIAIENFENTVSEKLGVGAVDRTTAAIARFLQSLSKKSDCLCRFTDDSFMLITPKVAPPKALEYARDLVVRLRDHIVDIDGKTLRFNYHAGVSVINETSTVADMPIDQSIRALEVARKENSAEGASLFEVEEPSSPERDISLAIQRAFDEGKFKLLFQPILSLRGSEKEHYEVLLRMTGDDNKDVSPKEFLAQAAAIGVAVRIDRWVILEATKTLAQHRKNGNNTVLIVHVSRESILDDSLIAWLKVVFKTAKLPPQTIIFQVNEVDINDHLNDAKRFCKAVTDLGCGLSVNHFGCVLNPFKVLDEIVSTHTKIDGSFTHDIQNNEEGILALNELVSQLHQKDKITIVPFVESASLLSKLWQSGVHYIQGYYLQGPAPNMDYDFDMET